MRSALQVTQSVMLAPERYATQPAKPISAVADHESGLVVNRLFRELKAIFPAWRNAWPTAEDEAAAKRSWTKAFISVGLTQLEQIRFGVEQCRLSSRPFMPSVGEFIQWCQPTPEVLGLPSAEKAYRQACALAHPAADRSQAHAAVFHAASETGLHLLASQPESVSRPVFDYHYGLVVKMVMRGEPLTETPRALPAKPAEPTDQDREKGAQVLDALLNKIKGKRS